MKHILLLYGCEHFTGPRLGELMRSQRGEKCEMRCSNPAKGLCPKTLATLVYL